MDFPRGLAGIMEVYGDPRPLLNASGTIDPEDELKWRMKILKRGVLPFPIPLTIAKPERAKKTFYAHTKLVEIFERIFERISQEKLANEIKSWGGIYNFRAVRARQKLSTHCWGISIDLNPEENRLGTPGKIHPDIVSIFKNEGFTWGGDFKKRKDPMHFQACSGY